MKTQIINRFQSAKIQTFILCSLLLGFSCTKEEKTDHDYPRVSTGLVTHIDASGATFNGSFLHAGKSEIIDHGFVFDTDVFPDIQSGEKISLGPSNGKGSFTATANFGMIAGTTYYVSAYAQNKNNIFYAEPTSFVSMGNATPEIVKIVPSEGMRGDTVVVKGKYFSQKPQNNTVMFGEEEASVITASDTALTVQVPISNNKEHVDVFVNTFGKTAQKLNGFRYLKPEITDLSSRQSMKGDTVTIRGKYFNRIKEYNIVKFGNNESSIIHHSDTALTVQVPSSNGDEFVDVFVTASGIVAQKVNGFQYLKPEITDFSPKQAVIGDTITITGQNFRSDVEIMFNQVRASVYQSDRTSARVIVPACQSVSANISAIIDGLTNVYEQSFRYAKPEVTGLSTYQGVIGNTIVVYGNNFGYQKDVVTVFLGEQSAKVLDVDNSSISLILPASGGKTLFAVTVRVDGQLAEGNQTITYLAPVIESFEPQNACGGDIVMIRGQNFLTTSQLNVSFGSYIVERFDKITDTEIQAVVPFSKGVEEAPILVTNNGITSISENSFRYLKPEIVSITPNNGMKNDQINVVGNNFGTYSTNLSVYFDNEKATVLEHTPNKLIVSVPKFYGNKLSEIKITRDGLTGVSLQKFQYMEPFISGFSPPSGRVGNTITINGQYFSNNKNDVRVYCGDSRLTVVNCADNQIVISIPNTVVYAKQPIRISVDGNEGISTASFEIISPWTKKAAHPDGSVEHSISWVYKDEGFLAVGQYPRNCKKYSPENDQWQIIMQNWDGNYNVKPFFFPIGDYCYYGGINSWDNNFYRVSFESLEKKDITKLPQQEVISNASSFLIDQKAYVCGGMVHSGNSGFNSQCSNDVWQYDPLTNEWTKKASLPGTARSWGFAFSYNGKGYVGMGTRDDYQPLDDIYEYDPQSDIWSRKNNFPIRAYGTISFSINNRIFAGLGNTGDAMIRDIWEYIPASDTWNHVAIIPDEGGLVSAETFVFIINNKAYIFGNRGFYEFDPSKL